MGRWEASDGGIELSTKLRSRSITSDFCKGRFHSKTNEFMLILLFRYVGMPSYISNNIQYFTIVAVKLPLYKTVWLVLLTACSEIYGAVPWDCGVGLPRASVRDGKGCAAVFQFERVSPGVVDEEEWAVGGLEVSGCDYGRV